MSLVLFKRDFKVAFYSLKEVFFIIAFLLFCGAIFPFALGSHADTLSRYGPGIMWILTLFSISLSLNAFFHKDEEDGSLDQLFIHTQNSYLLFLLKATVQTIILGGCLLLANFVLCFLFHLPFSLILWVMASLLISLPSFVFIGGLVAALTLEAPLSPFIRPIILFPFYLPLLIFGVSIVDRVLASQSPLPCFKILTAISLLNLCYSTVAAGKILLYRYS